MRPRRPGRWRRRSRSAAVPAASNCSTPAMPAASVNSPGTTTAYRARPNSSIAFEVARAAGRTSGAAAAVDVDDPRVPQRDEVLDREVGADGLVGHDPVERALAHLAAEHDQRRMLGGGGDRRGREMRRDQDQPVGAVLQQRVEHRLLAPLVAPAGDDQQAVAERRRGLLDRVRDVGEERVVEVVEQARRSSSCAGSRARAPSRSAGTRAGPPPLEPPGGAPPTPSGCRA